MKISKIIAAAAFAATMFSCTKEPLLETPRVSLTFSVALRHIPFLMVILIRQTIRFRAVITAATPISSLISRAIPYMSARKRPKFSFRLPATICSVILPI